MRPCEEHKPCCYEEFDYGEDMTVCGIDFDGENCPWIKPWGRKKYNERHHKKDGDGEKSVEGIEEFLRGKEQFMFEWHDGGDDIY